jgi:hypothetical protein
MKFLGKKPAKNHCVVPKGAGKTKIPIVTFFASILLCALAVNLFPTPLTDSGLIRSFESLQDKYYTVSAQELTEDVQSSDHSRLEKEVFFLEKKLQTYSLDDYADAVARTREKELGLDTNGCGNTLPKIFVPDIYTYRPIESISLPLTALIASRAFNLECALKSTPVSIEYEMGAMYPAGDCKRIIFQAKGNTAIERRIASILNIIKIGDSGYYGFFNNKAYESLVDGENDIIITPETPGSVNKHLASNKGTVFLPKIIAVSGLAYFSGKPISNSNFTSEQLSNISNLMQIEIPLPENTKYHYFVYDIDTEKRYELGKEHDTNSGNTSFNDKRRLIMESTMGGAPTLCEVLQFDSDFSRQTFRIDSSVYSTVYWHKIHIAGSSFDTLHFGYAGGPRYIISIDNVMPTLEAIRTGEYPLCYPIYAVIRADQPKDSPEYRLWEWFSSEEGQCVISQAGLVPASEFAKISDFENRLERFNP